MMPSPRRIVRAQSMSAHDKRVHASGDSGQADQVRREDLSLWAAVLQVVVQAGAPASLSLSPPTHSLHREALSLHPPTPLTARQHQSHDSRRAHCCTVINRFSSVELRWPWLFGGRLRQRDPSLSYGCAGLPGRGARHSMHSTSRAVECSACRAPTRRCACEVARINQHLSQRHTRRRRRGMFSVSIADTFDREFVDWLTERPRHLCFPTIAGVY